MWDFHCTLKCGNNFSSLNVLCRAVSKYQMKNICHCTRFEDKSRFILKIAPPLVTSMLRENARNWCLTKHHFIKKEDVV